VGTDTHSFCTYECPTTAETSDTGRAIPQHMHCLIRLNLLLPMRHTNLLASPDPIYDLGHVVQRWHQRNAQVPIQLPSFPASVVPLRVLLPGSSTSYRRVTCNAKVHLWLPSSRNYLAWGFRSLLHRGNGVFSAVSRNHEYAPHAGLELSDSHLSRLLPRHGFGVCISRVL
jgi:hypothetical protein